MDLICMMILRLAFAKPNHHSDWSQLTRRRTISLSPLRSKCPNRDSECNGPLTTVPDCKSQQRLQKQDNLRIQLWPHGDPHSATFFLTWSIISLVVAACFFGCFTYWRVARIGG